MLMRSAWPFCVLSVLALVAAGCQQSSNITNTRNVSDVGGEKSPNDKSAAALTFESSAPSQMQGVYSATSGPIEIAVEAIQPHMAIGSDDRIYLAFIHRGNISVSISHDHGNSFSDPVIAIDVGGHARGGAHRGPRIGVDKHGIVTVSAPVTFDDAEYQKRYPTSDLFLVRSTDDGKTWSKPRQVNEVAKQAPEALHWMAVSPLGEVHVAWLDRRDRKQSGQDIYYATVIDGDVAPNSKIANTVCECCAPGLAVDASGNPFVAFREGGDKSSREIFARWSTDGGRSFADATQINRQKTLENG